MFKRAWPITALIIVCAAFQCAQAQICSVGGQPCVYSVKFICGDQPNPNLHAPSEPPVKPGNYATSINVHNYHLDQTAAGITKTAVIANPENAPSLGLISAPPHTINLPPGRAFEIDCADIVSLFPSTVTLPQFIKGFVELRGSFPTLSVTAVYTAQPTTPGTGPSGPVSIEVVPVQPFPGP
jgi:hypothetical protein